VSSGVNAQQLDSQIRHAEEQGIQSGGAAPVFTGGSIYGSVCLPVGLFTGGGFVYGWVFFKENYLPCWISSSWVCWHERLSECSVDLQNKKRHLIHLKLQLPVSRGISSPPFTRSVCVCVCVCGGGGSLYVQPAARYMLGAARCMLGPPRCMLGMPHCTLGMPHCMLGPPRCILGAACCMLGSGPMHAGSGLLHAGERPAAVWQCLSACRGWLGVITGGGLHMNGCVLTEPLVVQLHL